MTACVAKLTSPKTFGDQTNVPQALNATVTDTALGMEIIQATAKVTADAESNLKNIPKLKNQFFKIPFF